ncbi:SPFH domain-containing protein [Thiopseudomonas acetoxidans]|uniref:Protein QmcA n=1 Tax=Thiopseudomonas acetoxidans TaxID=3041622 RepID=A0ABT7SQX2_9GAMM|nr:SPFH domain-containing protein [Thiopseudomonas sp. CY1220]MDM7858394.1 SPFH domain-containing protein [Thiopseudomonas sp. CY1220]
MDSILILFGLLAILAIVFFSAGVKVVPQGQQWTVERFGRYTQTLEPGLGLIIPFIDRIGFKLSMMESVLDVPSQTVISKDNAAVTADGVLFYRILDASKAAYQVTNLTYAIINLTVTNLRSVLGSMELDHMLSNREEVNERLLSAVDLATAPWGIKVTRIEIRDLSMSPALQEAMNLQMTAERHRRAVVTKANGDKEAEILQAEGLRQAAILRADGEKQAAFLIAEAREREAQAEAQATKDVSEAIREGDVHAIQYFLGLKYIEALQEIGKGDNSKLVLMPLEAAGVTGAVAGITELLKNSQGK